MSPCDLKIMNFVPYAPLSPLASKRRRLDEFTMPELPASPITAPFSPHFLPALSPLPSLFVQPLPVPSAPVHNLAKDVSSQTSAGLQESLNRLDAQTHAIRLERATKAQSNKQTGESYQRHIRNYEKYWATFLLSEHARDPLQTPVPANPITATKVAIFLEHETTRQKEGKPGQDAVFGTNVGKSSISQAISALEWQRLNHQHLYKDIPDAQLSLRRDTRIRQYESDVKSNEPQRIAKSQVLKAAGTSVDSYTDTDLAKLSNWCMSVPTTFRQVWTYARDRAMLLLPTATAFRGDSVRNLLWSDLFVADVPMPALGLGTTVPALAMLADNAKHNQNGRVDEHGAFRHRLVELCPVGALALLYFCHFHVLELLPPGFVPDFKDTEYGEYGRRDWYNLHVFWAAEITHPMSYDNHRNRVNHLHINNGIATTHVTHVGRIQSAQTARKHGASVSGTKALGGWNESGAFRACYDRALPVDALLGAAMFNANKPEDYFLARDHLEPPQELLQDIFPWIAAEQSALDTRQKESPFARDIALKQFLKLLLWFRRVLLQDLAVLYSRDPSCKIFRIYPFNTDRFQKFAITSGAVIDHAEEDARLAFQHLPEHLVASLRGVVSTVNLAQQQESHTNIQRWTGVENRLTTMEDLLQQVLTAQIQPTSKRKRKAVCQDEDSVTPPVSVLPSAPLVCTPPPTICASSSAQPSPSVALPIHGATTITINFGSSPSSLSTASVSPTGIVLSQERVSAGSAPEPVATPLISSSPVIAPDSTDNLKHVNWAALATKYSDLQLRKHNWEWTGSEWLPWYSYQAVKKISDIWTEWADGLNGYLPVRILHEQWAARWRRNTPKLKTEAGRRDKIVRLVQELQNKPRWDIQLSLRFLHEQYEKRYSARQFSDYLGSRKNGTEGHQAVLAAADSYP